MSSHSVSPSITYLGLDVHKDFVTIAVLRADASAPTRIDKFRTISRNSAACSSGMRRTGRCGRAPKPAVRGMCCSAMQGWGFHCDVIAPSLIPVKRVVQRKNDKYDAGQLARLYRSGELTVIRIPSEAEERVRDVVRCRETFQREVVKSRHYILKFSPGAASFIAVASTGGPSVAVEGM